MTIPASSSFPDAMDNDNNLFLVHDSLRVRLSEDYNPGDTAIYVEGDLEVMQKFPETGIITLTEQCNEDIDRRALSFYYSSRPISSPYSFGGLELLPEFSSLDSPKPKKATNVTMNVLNLHHNHLKDALIKVEEFLGTKYNPADKTITKRIDYLKSVALAPKAWFSSDVSYGLAQPGGLSPGLTVKFKNESLRVGDGYVKQTWNFRPKIKPNSSSSSSYGETLIIETNNPDEYASNSTLEKTFMVPDVYTVRLTVENQYGSDSVEFEEMITVRTECPEPATIQINYRSSQKNISTGSIPKIRSSTNTFVDIEIPDGSIGGYSFGGELLGLDGSPVDPILEYTWNLGDDLPHPDSKFARASYEIGGYYDITLRVDTSFGAYRITSYDNSIDIIEQSNLWLFNQPYGSYNTNSSGNLNAYEFGLKSETFKLMGNASPHIDRNNSFLSESPLNYDSNAYASSTFEKAKNEFENNIEFVKSGSADSGDNDGRSLLFWAKGGSSLDSKEIAIKKYNAFDDVYENVASITNRPWNWVALSSSEKTYFLFGQYSPISPGNNPALPEKVEYDISTESAASPVTLSSSNFENGADELLSHPSIYDEDEDVATNGYFASYRAAWKDQTGYILRNSSVNEFFRFGQFYKTKGTLASPFSAITKMPDMPGSIKTEGQLVSLFNGVFFFNNSGEICAWNETSLSWEVGRASATSLSFRSVQDTSTDGFDNKSHLLKAASDGDRMAYLSYDYSSKAFIKFNGTDLTFTVLKQRPEGKQFKLGVY